MLNYRSKISAVAGQGIGFLLATLAAVSIQASFPLHTGLDGNSNVRADGMIANDFRGYSVSHVSDFNADGISDLIVGAPHNASLPSATYLLYGSASGPTFPANLSTLSGSDGITNYSQLGSPIANAGDINGDGVTDVIVGVPGESAAYVLLGKVGLILDAVPVGGLSGSNGFRISGIPGSQLGFSVANAGDVNGDGLNDIVVGNGAANFGVGYVIFGNKKGLPADLDVRHLDGNTGFAMTGAGSNVSSFIVTGAGDFNGDGVGDLLIGSWHGNAAYVVFGSNSGFSASVSLATLDGSNGFHLTDGSTTNRFGYAVTGIGDFNDDGIADIAVGAAMASTSSSNGRAGKTYVVFGADTSASTLNVTSLNGRNGLQIDGTTTNDLLECPSDL